MKFMDQRPYTTRTASKRTTSFRQCDLIGKTTAFRPKFEKSFIFCCALVEFTHSLHFLEREKAYSDNF